MIVAGDTCDTQTTALDRIDVDGVPTSIKLLQPTEWECSAPVQTIWRLFREGKRKCCCSSLSNECAVQNVASQANLLVATIAGINQATNETRILTSHTCGTGKPFALTFTMFWRSEKVVQTVVLQTSGRTHAVHYSSR